MKGSSRVMGSLPAGGWLIAIAALFVSAAWGAPAASALQAADTEDSAVRVVHGVANAGPLDVYVDGAIALIGIVFGETSGNLTLEPGNHAFAVVPSGAAPGATIVDGQISLQEGTAYYGALFGVAEEASVGLYAIDDRPVDAGRARFRIISGLADAGEIVPAFASGDALTEPLQFGDASQYAAIDAGDYDFEILDAVTGASVMSLPQTPIAEGTATDIVLIGQLSDGTLQALVVPTAVEITAIEGRVARVFSGVCAALGPVVADIGAVLEGQGAAVGVSDTLAVAQGFGVASVAFAALTATPHALVVLDTGDEGGGTLACGEIGGQLTDTGALVIALQAGSAGGSDGVAVLAPALENPDTTGVSVFLTTGSATGATDATPVSDGQEPAA